VVCIASANAGNTSQDLKTGFLVGGTPRKQQYGLLIGVAVSVLAIGAALIAMNKALETFSAVPLVKLDVNALPDGINVQSQSFERTQVSVVGADRQSTTVQTGGYWLLNALGSKVL